MRMSNSFCMLNGLPVHFARPTSGSFAHGEWNDQVVAVRVINSAVDPEELRTRNQLWRTIVHPNVLQIFGACNDEQSTIIVSPFCPVGNVTQYLAIYPNVDRPKLIYEAALALQFLHSSGIIHGALKPSNLLISDEGTLTVSDYGLVELQPSSDKDAHRYWSPEAWKGTLSKPSDVFAFAMTAYELFSSAPPWGAQLSEKHIYQLVVYEHGRPDRPDEQIAVRVGLTDEMWSLIDECWDKEARLRPTFDMVVRLWAAQLQSSSGFSTNLPQPIHQLPKSIDDASSIHSYSSGPPAYEAEFPHLMPPSQPAFPPQPVPLSQPAPIITTYTSLLPPSVASYVGSSYSPPPLLPGMEPIRPLQIRNRRGDSASPQRSLSTTESKLQQTDEQPASTSMTPMFSLGTSLPAPSTLPPMPPAPDGWEDQTPSSLSSSQTQSRNETPRSWSRPPSRNEIERPSSRASNRSISRAASEGDSRRSDSPFRGYQVINRVPSTASKHLSSSFSLRSVSSYNLRPTITTSARGLDEFDNKPARTNTYSSTSKQPPSIPPILLEEQTPEEGPRSPLQHRFASPEPLPPGAANVPSPPQQTQANSQFFPQTDTAVGYGLSAPTTPAWDVRSFASEGPTSNRGTSSITASTNAVALVGALQTAINNTGALSSPLEFGSRREEEEEDEEAGEAEIDFILLKIHALACQSEKDAQKLVTAGIVPVLLGLMTTRFRAWKTAKKKGPDVSSINSRHGLEMVLITLGATAYDSISANIINRTGTITTLIDIFSSFSSSSAIEDEAAQREQIATLALWCLTRICRSAELANGMIKADLVAVICSKTLRIGFAHSNLIGRYGAWLLGNLIYTDSIAESIDLKYGIVAEVVEYLRRVVGRSSPSNTNGGSSPPAPAPEDVSAALYALARLSRTMKLSKSLTIGVKPTKNGTSTDMGTILLLSSILSTSNDALLLGWASRTVGCLIRPNSAEVARAMLDGGIGTGLSRVPRVLTTEEALGLTSDGSAPSPLASFAFAISRFSCAEWGAGIRKRLVEDGVVDSLLSALRTASDEPCPDEHVELALAVSFLGDVGGRDIRKEVIRAGGVEILKQVADDAKTRGGKRADEVVKACNMAVTSITGNLLTRNAASAKTAMTHDWSGGCPEYQPPCPFSIDIQDAD